MAATYQSHSGDLATATSDTSLVATKPTGLAVGDQLVAVAVCVDARTISPPSGWATDVNNTDGTNRIYIFTKAATSGDVAATDFTFTVSGTFNAAGVVVVRVAGGTNTGLTSAFATGANSQTLACANLTSPGSGSLALWGFYQPSGTSGPATISRGTERYDAQNATAGVSLYLATEDVGSGTITGPTITKTGFGAGRAFSIGIATSAPPATYTASGALSIQPATFAGAATFTKPIYAASATLNSSHPTLSGSATFLKPVYAGAAALATGSVAFVGSSVFTKPAYTSGGALTPQPAILAAFAGGATPAYTGLAALTAAPATLAGAATAQRPVYAAVGALLAGASALAGLATSARPVYRGAGVFLVGAATLRGFTVPPVGGPYTIDMAQFFSPGYTTTQEYAPGIQMIQAGE